MTVRELEDVGTIWRKQGEEVHVRICDAGFGPAVDVREFLTDEGPAETVGIDRGLRTVGKDLYIKRERPAYVGPTKRGFWLSVDQAVALSELLAQASFRAEAIIDERTGGVSTDAA